jgi:hypothetical protein
MNRNFIIRRRAVKSNPHVLIAIASSPFGIEMPGQMFMTAANDNLFGRRMENFIEESYERTRKALRHLIA